MRATSLWEDRQELPSSIHSPVRLGSVTLDKWLDISDIHVPLCEVKKLMFSSAGCREATQEGVTGSCTQKLPGREDGGARVATQISTDVRTGNQQWQCWFRGYTAPS